MLANDVEIDDSSSSECEFPWPPRGFVFDDDGHLVDRIHELEAEHFRALDRWR